MDRQFQTSFLKQLFDDISNLGGLFNAHLHFDRVETFEATARLLNEPGSGGVSSLGLAQKHGLIPLIHASDCYDPDLLEVRVAANLEKMAALGTTNAHSVVDVTTDRVGTTALERLLKISRRYAGSIDFRVGAYSPLGFRDDEPQRWTLIEEAAEIAHFIGGLPERDDCVDYPDHIGFEASCERVMQLGYHLGKPVHIHVDQKNHDRESHTESVIRLVKKGGYVRADEEPFIWLIHVISPSSYDNVRFERLSRDLAELNIGVISCPLAALSMRQFRSMQAPTHNSIARVLELLAAGVFVRLGSDNVCDITSPAGTLDLMDELITLAHAVRYFDLDVLASLGAGRRLSSALVERIADHLADDAEQCRRAHDSYEAAVRAARELR